MKHRLVVSALLIAAPMGLVSGCGDGNPASTGAHRFAVFVASDEECEQYFVAREVPRGRAIFTEGEPLLTEREIARLHLGEFAGGNPMLMLDLTDVGIRTLSSRADDYVGRKLAVVWDYQVVSVPHVQDPLSSQIAIVSSELLPASKLESIAAYFRAQPTVVVQEH